MTCDEIQQQYLMLSNNLLVVNMSIQSTQANIAALSLQLSVTDTLPAVPLQPYTQTKAQTRSAQTMTLTGMWSQLSQYFTALGGYQATAAQLRTQLDSLIAQWNDGGCAGSISG